MVSKKTFEVVRRRMKWAALGAGVGAALGAISNPKWAGTGGAIGGTAGALAANLANRVESRVEDSRVTVEEVSESRGSRVDAVVDRISTDRTPTDS